MCDSSGDEPAPVWHGWSGPSAHTARPPIGEWVDLTYPFSSDVPRISTFDAPRFERIREMPADPLNVTRFETVVHCGTHLDAPNHFVIGAPSVDEVPLDRLMGRGVVVRINKGRNELVDADDLEGEPGRVPVRAAAARGLGRLPCRVLACPIGS